MMRLTLTDLPRAAVLLVVAALLTGCSAWSASPTSSYTDSSGETVTVDWADYPAQAGQDGEALLEYPDQAELEPGARQLMDALRVTISDASGADLNAAEAESAWFGDENWYPQEGNGYGGDSLLTTINCCELRSDSIADASQWQTVLDAASETAKDAGLGPFVRDVLPEYCVGRQDQCWFQSATATDGVQWVYLTMEDRTLDASGDASREADRLDLPLAGIAIGYGATVVQAGRAGEYRNSIQPFTGLDRPVASTSD
jgi:hypothetical protein